MTSFLVSDLHLDESRSAAIDCFLTFLRDDASSADALYILGDLFDAWIGDDAVMPAHRTVIEELRRLTARGTRCYFLRGNRDFLVGDGFCAATGVKLLADEAVVTLEGRSVLLMHGDTLCTDDHAYQRLRRIVHFRALQSAFLRLPCRIRLQAAAVLRRRSVAASAGKPESIMDVNPQAVLAAMRRNGVTTLVHGHTHRQAVHAIHGLAGPGQRIVLGDWYASGSVLRWDRSGPGLELLRFAADAAQPGVGNDSSSATV
jgi:UDP-2,3-diacylglucosamine hydrolase